MVSYKRHPAHRQTRQRVENGDLDPGRSMVSREEKAKGKGAKAQDVKLKILQVREILLKI